MESADAAVVLMVINKIRKLPSCNIELSLHFSIAFSLAFPRLLPILLFSILRVYDELLHADGVTSELCRKTGLSVCLSRL